MKKAFAVFSIIVFSIMFYAGAADALCFGQVWGASGAGTGQFNHQSGIAESVINGTEYVYVADTGNKRVEKFDANGNFLGQFQSWTYEGWSYSFNEPTSVAVGPSGDVYVADGYDIAKFDANGNFLTMWSKYNGYSISPSQVAVDSSGNVYVGGNGAYIYKYDANGNQLAETGRITDCYPGGMAFGIENGVDYLYAGMKCINSNGYQDEIMKFGTNINLITQWNSSVEFSNYNNPNYAAQSAPQGVATDASGNVYVADPVSNRVQEFDPNGKYLAQWGSYGAGDGMLNSPAGISVDASGDVLTADTYNNRMEEFVPGCMVSATVLYNGTAQPGAYLYLRPGGHRTPLEQYFSSNQSIFGPAADPSGNGTVSIFGPTDANGNVSINPSLFPATYDVMIRMPSAYHYNCIYGRDCGPAYYGPPIAGDLIWRNRGSVSIGIGQDADLGAVDLAVDGGGTTISGTVASGGKPMIGWLVKAATGPIEPLLYGPASFPNSNTALITSVAVTDANGNYTLTLPDQAASYYITACSAPLGCQWWGYQGGYGAGAGGTAQATSVSAGQQETGVNINVP